MKYPTLLFLFLTACVTLFGQEVKNLQCEYFQNPVGIDAPNPKLSWIIHSDKNNVLQTAYQVQVADSPKALERGKRLIWDSGKVSSGQSIHVAYQGPALSARQRLYWRVKVWTNQGGESPWSETNFWEMGLLKPSDWTAQWIEAELPDDTTRSNPAQYFRKGFQLKGQPVSARAYVTSHGLYETFINGKRVGDWLFTPGWTSYNERLQYQVYDVTSLLQKGGNAIGATLGDGWYRGVLAWGDNRNHYGSRLALLMQLEVQYADGTKEMIVTDGSWKAAHGPILGSEIYNGEVYDARQEKEGWRLPGYEDSNWAKVRTMRRDKQNLVAQMGLPVRQIEEVKPVQLIYTPQG
ncbi:MAG TPA: alpha-L-rhamnosidase N-terminal domain-containing protein, partial [Saprospiraceae bacterium]|nr:alpha-L-rhamnosidase N-terminal domain-containing protein [Saprospiraceae bacterium]